MTATFGPTVDAVAVEVPLVRGDGDPRSKVVATIEEAHELVAVLEPRDGSVTLGGILAARLGIRVSGDRATIRKLRVGDLLLDDVDVRVVAGEELTIGVGGVPDLAAAVLPDGVVRFVHAADAGTLPLAESPLRWRDAATVRAGLLDAEAVDWPVPSVGEDLLARLRWARLAETRWAAGDVSGALAADRNLERVAGDRCELHLAMGERALRAGQDGAPALRRAAELYDAWLALTPDRRQHADLRQPYDCARARDLLDGVDPAEPDLRARIVAGDRLDPGVRLALAAVLVREGRTEPARAWATRAGDVPDPHPLVTAMGIAAVIGPDALPDGWLAGRVVTGTATPEEVEAWRVGRPGDRAAECLVALAAGAPVPAGPEADCLAARGAWSELRVRWPDLWVDWAPMEDP